MPIPTLQYLKEDGTLISSYPEIPQEILLRGYRTMCLTRHVDEHMTTLQRQGSITFALSSSGEEACAVASAAALELCDWIYPQYREAGVFFWRGGTALQFIHHMFGNKDDLTYGRQMPNHFGSKALNIVTVSSPIGTKIPHAAGCAYAMKMLKEQSVAVCYFGEGAASEGDFHAGLNFAAVRKAPAIFFCRNNGYAISTKCDHQYASEGIAAHGSGYGIQAYRIDGNDFFAVYDAVKKARKHCLEGHGPVLIEAMTYRMGAHSTSDDPTLYRSAEEVEKWKEKDPIMRLRRYLEKQGLWSEEKEKIQNSEIEKEINAAIAIAKETPPPPFHIMIEDVYSEIPNSLQEQFNDLKRLFSND